MRRQRNRSWWETDYTSLSGSKGTGSASWSIQDPDVNSGCADLEELGSCGGRANQVLGAAVLSRGTSARVPGQSETYRHDLADEREPAPLVQSVVVIPSDLDQPEASPERQEPGPSGSSDRMTLVGPVASPVTSLPCTPGRDILLPGDAEESPRSREGGVAAATLEQEMGRRSVAAAIRPIKDRAVASSSSATDPITQRMVAEVCGTLIREKHQASPPKWPKGSGHLPRRKTASTVRPERGRSPAGAEQGPVQAMFSPSPVVRQEKPSSLRTHVPETEESKKGIGTINRKRPRRRGRGERVGGSSVPTPY